VRDREKENGLMFGTVRAEYFQPVTPIDKGAIYPLMLVTVVGLTQSTDLPGGDVL